MPFLFQKIALNFRFLFDSRLDPTTFLFNNLQMGEIRSGLRLFVHNLTPKIYT